MGYKINYDEMYTIVGHINKKLVHISNVLNCLYNAFTELSETENIKGKTADSIKGYIKDVHMNLIIPAIYEVINCIYLKSTMYFFGMHNVDSDSHAYIDEENLIALKTVLKELGIRLCDIIDSGQDIKRNISGTVEIEFPDSDRMAEDMQSLTDIITRLDEDMQLHETEGLAAADELYNTLSKLWTLIRERRDKDIDIGSYTGEDFSKYDYVKGIVEALNKESIYIQEHEAELISAEERQAEAIEALESEQRERGGKNKVLTSVLNMIQGGVTMYLALTTKNVSMLIKGGMIFFSLTSIGYNTNELEIGLDDMYYGSIGDIYTESEGWLNISEDAEPYYHFAGKLATIMTDVGGVALGIKALKALKSDDVANVVNGSLSKDRVSYYLNESINNGDSNITILGTTGNYDVVGETYGYLYFKMDDDLWIQLEKEVMENYDEIWKVNKQFIDDQIGVGNRILLSNDPYQGYYFADGTKRFYQRELDYLKELGYSFERVGDDLWEVVK